MRLASLVPGATETLFAVGRGHDVVARTHECTYPEETAAVPIVTRPVPGGDGHLPFELDYELLSETSPDLVIVRSRCDACETTGCALPDGSNILVFDPHTLAETLDSVEGVAAAAGAADQGRALRQRLDRRIDWIHQHVAGRPRPRVAVIEWPDPFRAPGLWVPDMVAAAGGENVFGRPGVPSHPATFDDLEVAHPEIVVLVFAGTSLYETQARLRDLARAPGWIRAARAARMVAVDADSYISRPGPRLADGVGLLSWAIHRSHPEMQPQIGRIAELIEAGWVDLAAFPALVRDP